MQKIKSRTILEYIAILFIILECASVYALSLNQVSIIMLPAIMALSILCIMNLNSRNNPLSGGKFLIFGAIFIANVLFLILNVSETFRTGLIVHFCLIFPLLIFYFATIPLNMDKMSIMRAGVNVMILESFVSVFFFVFASVLGIIQPTGSVFVNWGSLGQVASYYNIYFTGQFMRNCGIFAEAPMHNYVLSVMLLFEAFINKNHKRWKIIVLMIAIATTTSTTGQLVLVSCIIFMLYNKWNMLRKGQKFLFSAILLFVCVVSYHFVDNVLNEKKETDSYSIRSEYLSTSFNTFLANPIFGTGYNSNTDGNSNSIATLLADGGLHLFILYFVPLVWLPFINFMKTKDRKRIFATMVFLGVFSITIVLYNALTLLIMAVPLSKLIQKQYRTYRV